jgi:hypothetical protein
MTAVNVTKQTFIYVGVRRGTKSLLDCYAPVDVRPGGGAIAVDDAAKWSTFRADRARRVVGGMYSISVEEKDGAKLFGLKSAEFVGPYSDGAAAAAWKAESDAILAADRAGAAERRAKSAGDALEALKPLRALWRRSIGHDRLALEVVVLSYLRTGVGS